jgi:hypothetical protein
LSWEWEAMELYNMRVDDPYNLFISCSLTTGSLCAIRFIWATSTNAPQKSPKLASGGGYSSSAIGVDGKMSDDLSEGGSSVNFILLASEDDLTQRRVNGINHQSIN